MTLPVDSLTPCYGKGDLFDSRYPADHAKAAKLCARCPLRGAVCKEWLEETVRLYPGGPQGTWSGQHINPKIPIGRPRKEAVA